MFTVEFEKTAAGKILHFPKERSARVRKAKIYKIPLPLIGIIPGAIVGAGMVGYEAGKVSGKG